MPPFQEPAAVQAAPLQQPPPLQQPAAVQATLLEHPPPLRQNVAVVQAAVFQLSPTLEESVAVNAAVHDAPHLQQPQATLQKHAVLSNTEPSPDTRYQVNSVEQILQLDGTQCSLPFDGDNLSNSERVLQCETCQMIFKSESEFNEHNKAEFCCDECGICYTTQLAAHFHELQEHPDTHYAKTYIPQSTKLLFASRLPSN